QSVLDSTDASGQGIHPRPRTHHPMRAHNLFAYSVLGHRHEAEVLQSWREWVGRPAATIRPMTHWGPFVRGIYLTLHARLERAIDGATVATWYREAYAGRPFVRLLDAP